MGLNKKKLLDISITTSKKEEILEEIKKRLESPSNKGQKTFIIVTPNPEQIVLAAKDKHFADVINQADVAIPDGIGVVWAINREDPTAHIQKIAGIEFMNDLLEVAANKAYPIGLIGGWPGVALKALERLQKKYPRLVGWAIEPEGKTVEEIRKKIRDTNTRIVFVAIGAPKQEFFIEKLDIGVVAMAVGGSFDVIAGRVPRAPFILRTIGVEWLWRLFMEPWRWRRQLSLLKFVQLVLSN